MSQLTDTSQGKITHQEGWWWNLLPPLKAAFKALRAAHPLSEIKRERFTPLWTFLVLLLIMSLGMIIIIAGENAPYVNPKMQLWDLTFKLYTKPEPNWPVLLVCGSYALAAGIFATGTSWWIGRRIGSTTGEKQLAVQLAHYGAVGAASFCLLIMLAIYSLSWLLRLLHLHMFALIWMSITPLVLVPVSTMWLQQVFRRAAWPTSKHFVAALAISAATIMGGVIAGLQIQSHLNASFSALGYEINKARTTPTPAVVQTCALDAGDVVCALTLFPSKWQDYELIGSWNLENSDKATNKIGHHRWYPARADNRALPIVALDAGKDTTVEIHIPVTEACGSNGTLISNDERFFFVSGYIRGQQQNPQLMRIGVNQTAPSLYDMVDEQCKVHISGPCNACRI